MNRSNVLFLLPTALLSIAALVGCESTAKSDNRKTPGGPTPVPASHGKRSTSLASDLKIMWSVQPKEEGRNWVTATEAAIDASERVFNTVDLRGQTADELGETLRFDLRSQDYGYYAPFWDVNRGVFPIRIDCGNYGWQYDVHFDSQKRVSQVMRRWIH
jgi:hypothetical protein